MPCKPTYQRDLSARVTCFSLFAAVLAGVALAGCGATGSGMIADRPADDGGLQSATAENTSQLADDLGPALAPGDEAPSEALGYYDPIVDGAGADTDEALDDASNDATDNLVLEFNAGADDDWVEYLDDELADSEWQDEWGDAEFVFDGDNLSLDEFNDAESFEEDNEDNAGGRPSAKIVGKDDRVHVENAARYPWQTIGLLWVEYGDGLAHLGTGAMISKRHVLTAAHVLYDEDNQRWPKKIVFIPAKNGDSEPLGRVGWSRARVFSTRYRGAYRRYDIGLLTLNQDIGDQTGWLGLAVRSNSYMTQTLLNTAGYPGDKGSYDQYATAGYASSIDNDVISTWIDNMPGQSGSPMWEVLNGQRYILGVINAQCTSGCNVNFGSRISSNAFNWIANAIKADG